MTDFLTAIQQANAELAPHDLTIFQLNNGRLVVNRIKRGGVKIEGHPPYDGYVQVGKSYATLEEALAAGRGQIAADRLRSRDPREHTMAGAARHFCDAS
jgi:hypothetical protein